MGQPRCHSGNILNGLSQLGALLTVVHSSGLGWWLILISMFRRKYFTFERFTQETGKHYLTHTKDVLPAEYIHQENWPIHFWSDVPISFYGLVEFHLSNTVKSTRCEYGITLYPCLWITS